MQSKKIQRLKKSGFKVGSVQQFLSLSDEDMTLIETKRVLILKLKEIRNKNEVTQLLLAELLGSSQSRVAKMEAGAPDVSLDLICRALFLLGVTPKDIGKTLAE